MAFRWGTLDDAFPRSRNATEGVPYRALDHDMFACSQPPEIPMGEQTYHHMNASEPQFASPAPKRRWYRLTPDRVVLGLLAVEGLLWLPDRFHWFPFNEHKGYAVLIAAASVAGAMSLMLLWLAAALVFRWRFQYSIRSVLVLAVVVAMLCSWFAVAMRAAREQKETVTAITKLGGTTSYQYWFVPCTPRGPAWLLEMLGDDFFNDVLEADLESDAQMAYLRGLPRLQYLKLFYEVTDDGMENVKGLLHLRMLEANNTNITDKGLRHLRGLTGLQNLSFYGDKVTDAGMEHLRGLTQLRNLNLIGAQVTDSGLERLDGLPRLQWLTLSNLRVSDVGLEHLKAFPRLQGLDLGGTQITDAGLKQLKPLTNLTSLAIWSTRVTGAGLEELKALPHLQTLSLSVSQLREAGVHRLKAMPQLEELNFDGSFADEDLEFLKELPQLHRAILYGAQTTEEGLTQFRQEMPKCEIGIAGAGF